MRYEGISFSRRTEGGVMYDTWSKNSESPTQKNRIIVLTGFAVRPPKEAEIQSAIIEYTKKNHDRRLERRIREANYMGDFPLRAAEYGNPVTVLWNPPELEMLPRYTEKTPNQVAEVAARIAQRDKKPAFPVSHSYGAFAHALLLKIENSNIKPGITIAPMTSAKDALEGLGMLQGITHRLYELLGLVNMPGVIATSGEYFHANSGEFFAKLEQRQRAVVSTKSGNALLKIELEDFFRGIPKESSPLVAITTNDRMISKEKQQAFAEKIGARKIRISHPYEGRVGHRVFTSPQHSQRLANIIQEEISR